MEGAAPCRWRHGVESARPPPLTASRPSAQSAGQLLSWGALNHSVQAGEAALAPNVSTSALSHPGRALTCATAGSRNPRQDVAWAFRCSPHWASRAVKSAGYQEGWQAARRPAAGPLSVDRPAALTCELRMGAGDEGQGGQPQQQLVRAHGVGLAGQHQARRRDLQRDDQAVSAVGKRDDAGSRHAVLGPMPRTARW